MKPPQARVFLEGVVLGLVRADLDQPSTRKDTRKLSPHLYEALKRALYKPAAFFKGIVFPLLDVSCSDPCEGLCVGWLIARVYVGRVHAQGGRHRRVGPRKGQSPTSALISCAHPPRRDGLLWCVLTRCSLSSFGHMTDPHADRPHVALHPHLAGQEARAAVQGARCARLPFHPAREHAGARHAARSLAPEPAGALPALCGAPRAGAERRATGSSA